MEGGTARLRARRALGDGLRFGYLPPFIRRNRVPRRSPGSIPKPSSVCGEGAAALQELKLRRHRNIAAHAYQAAIELNKAKGRWHLRQRPFVLFTDFRRSGLRRHFPPILTDIAEDKKRPPVLLFQIP